MINANKPNAICETALVGDMRDLPDVSSSNQFHTFPRANHSGINSPRKYRLSPEYEQKTRSPSASPKLKKRVVIPTKPSQIDNTSLVIPNQYKVSLCYRVSLCYKVSLCYMVSLYYMVSLCYKVSCVIR